MLKAITALALIATPALAEFDKSKLAFETGISTLGAYVAPRYELSDKLSLRAPLYGGSISDDFDDDGTVVTGTFDTKSFGLVADYAPFAGSVSKGFYVSGGLLSGGYDVSGTTGSINTDFGPVAGNFGVNITQKTSVAPVASLGYRYEMPFGMTAGAELGAKLAKYEASVSGLGALSASDLAKVQAEVDKINNDLSDVPALPFVTLSLGFAF